MQTLSHTQTQKDISITDTNSPVPVAQFIISLFFLCIRDVLSEEVRKYVEVAL